MGRSLIQNSGHAAWLPWVSLTDIERHGSGSTCKIKRLFRIHGQSGHVPTVKDTRRIVVAGFVKLAVTKIMI